MNYPDKIIVLPLENKVLLPSMTLRLELKGKQARELTRSFFRHQSGRSNNNSDGIYVACITLKPTKQQTQSVDKDEDDIYPSQAPEIPTLKKNNSETYNNLVCAQKRNRLMDFGCLAKITKGQRLADNSFGIFIEGKARFRVNVFFKSTPTLMAENYWMVQVEYNSLNDSPKDTEAESRFQYLSHIFLSKVRELNLPKLPLNELADTVNTMPISSLVDLIVSSMEITFDEKLNYLSTYSLQSRLKLAANYMTRLLHTLSITNNIGFTIDGKLDSKQREFYLKQQLEEIQSDPRGDQKQQYALMDVMNKTDNEENELSGLYQQLAQANLPNEVVVTAERELKRIKRIPPISPEWAVSMNYLKWLADLPWAHSKVSSLDIQRSREQLDHDHFGLEHVKTRIIEYLSVLKIKGDLKAPILCLVGPPGVGKTSLGMSIAKSMSREFHRISLGGIREEADMRGHRRTYVGSMPGLIIQGLKKCKVNNPVFLLDEIDKLGHNPHHGDPAAALLEILDPEQNNTFSDHYLNVSFDLSKILFIATANTLDTIPGPLRDRMEFIELHGYTFEEKLHIARSHIIPKQISIHGLEPKSVKITNDAILCVAEHYTRESGVRNLQRNLASLIRAKCVELATLQENNMQDEYSSLVDVEHVGHILGKPKFGKEVAERESNPGIVAGLVYSGSGQGSILFVEASKMPGNSELQLTGSLGRVIQESANIALSWVKGNAYSLKLTSHPREKLIQDEDIHIHFPSGSVPKDGPSAGIALVCAIVSLYSGHCVSHTTAMTGEMSLRGQVLPVGSIKEKIISAHRAGIKKVIVPKKNQKDVETHVPKVICGEMEIFYVKNIWEVLDAAFDCYEHEGIAKESHL